MQLAHGLAQDGRIAHASVEHPHGWWYRLQVFEFHPNALSNDPLFTTGGDKEEVFLAVVEKSERPYCRITVHGILPLYGCTAYVWL
jgi:hypothetical protein